MDITSIFAGLIIGVLGGVLGVVLYYAKALASAREQAQARAEEKAALLARAEEKEARLSTLTAEAAQAREKIESAARALAEAEKLCATRETELANEKRLSQEKMQLLQEAEKKLQDTFKALSAEALNKNNQAFLDLAKTRFESLQKSATDTLDSRQKAIGEMVKPIAESLLKVDSKLQEVEKARSEAYGAIRKQMEMMAGTQEGLRSETANLVKALRTPIGRGRWGEIQLRRVVEMAGMLDHCDFFEQQSASTETGRLRPDLIVKLPGGKNVIVDAKTPLSAYLAALEKPENEREELLKEHARHVRDHIANLSGKAYWNQFDFTPEFVVMFLPGEAFFSAALQYDPALIEFGVERRVIVASPTTLIALLRAVSYGWHQEKIAENAQAISALGAELYDRVRVMAEHFARLGKSLDGSVEAYNKTVRSLESRVLVTARRMKEGGVASTRDVPLLEGVEHSAVKLQAEDFGCNDAEEGTKALRD